MPGKLIVADGPNGVGKTTTAWELGRQIAKRFGVLVTNLSQPSNTPFGQLVRSGEAGMTGHALAMAVAADRLHQYQDDIAPILAADGWVVLDRHTPSSLVLQRIDGLSLPEIWGYNRLVPAADLTFYLTQTAEVITARMRARDKLSRLEKMGSAAHELELYEDAKAFLEAKGWLQVTIDCGELTTQAIVEQMMAHIETHLRRNHG